MKKTVKRVPHIANPHHLRAFVDEAKSLTESQAKMYRFGFWLFFILVIFSVTFSVWAITSIYSNFQVVTKILDESFERTNLVLDITSSKIAQCEQQMKDCALNGYRAVNPATTK